MVAASAMAGGQVRIGMEDAVWLGRGQPAPSNAAMVDKARRILDALGHDLATCAQTRQRLGLGLGLMQ